MYVESWVVSAGGVASAASTISEEVLSVFFAKVPHHYSLFGVQEIVETSLALVD